jgi:VWFA-related protein
MIRRVPLAALALGTVALAEAALGAGQAPASTPQPQQPTFKVQVDYVEVDALVTDRTGNFVRDLKKEDFQVIEDGRPQNITTFALVDIPIERLQRPLGAALPIEPDVKTNERPFDGRVYVMVIDDFHTGFGRTARVKRAAKQFIERNLGSNDLMAIVHTVGGTSAGQEFTSNKRLLLAAVDKTMGRKLRSATAEMTDEYYRTRGLGNSGPLRDPADQERSYNARSALDTLKNVADWFGGVHGRRKTILFVSEGIDYNINDVFNNQGASTVLDATREAIASATKSNVSIYGIDPRGLTNLGDEDIEIGAYPDDPTVGVSNASLQNELRLSQDSLRVLSEETGGFAAVNRNEFTTAFDRIVQDNSSYYVLAYYPPTTDKRDGRFHKIEVRVSRPGLIVRSRKGYASPKTKAPPATTVDPARAASAEIRDALDSPLPVSGLTLHVFAEPFKGTSPNASVLLGIEMRGRDLRLTPNSKVDVSYVAVDVNGKIKAGSSDSLSWTNLKPDTRTRIEQGGIRLLNRIDVPAGRYQLRFAARDSAGGALGSVTYDLTVPDFFKAPLSMSGLTLGSLAGGGILTTKPDEQLKAVLPVPPAALRVFPLNDELALFAEVYDNGVSTPHKVDITTTVTSDDSKVVFKTDEERSSADLLGKKGGYGYTARIPMRDLGPGTFVVKVEARSRLGQGITASREVQFTVAGQRPVVSPPAATPVTTPPASAPPTPPPVARAPSATPPTTLAPPQVTPPAGARQAPPPTPHTPPVQTPMNDNTALPIKTLDKGTQSNVEDARQVVVRSADELTKLWTQHSPDRKPPAVDFSQNMVVAVFMGSRPTAGFQIEIVGTREEAGALVVQYREVIPTIRAMTAQVLTMPYHLALVPKRAGEVRFEKVK